MFFNSSLSNNSIHSNHFNLTVSEPINLLDEAWFNFTVTIKVDLVMANLLIEEFNLNKQQAYSKLRYYKKRLLSFSNIHSSVDMNLAFSKLFESQQRQIFLALNLKKKLLKYPLLSYQEAKESSLKFLQQESIPSHIIEEACLFQLQDSLNNWVDWDHAGVKLRDALQVLKAVIAYYKQPFPYEFFHAVFDREKFTNFRFLRESALFWKLINNKNLFQQERKKVVFHFFELENEYFKALPKIIYEKKLIEKLFSTENFSNKSQAIIFNGFAFKNAKGKFFNDLINAASNEFYPEYKKLNLIEKKFLLQEKFYHIGESTRYAIGSLEHSLDSCLIRIFRHWLGAEPFAYRTINQKIDLFMQTEDQWNLSHKIYPIQPRLLLALHLAESNNIRLVEQDTKTMLKQLFEYLAKEFEKITLSPPQFDREKTAINLLKEMGMSLAEINQARYYVIVADDMNLSYTYFGTPLEQFMRVAAWTGIVGRTMHHGRTQVYPKEALQEAEITFNNQLYQDPWIQNQAIHNLERQHKEILQHEVEKEAKRIAISYLTETENHRAWLRGVETWVGTIPIIGPLYTIEEGIRDRSVSEIVFGTFFLSLDALDLLSGSERKSLDVETEYLTKQLSIREQMTVDTIHFSVKKLGLSPDDLPLDHHVSLHNDPFFISHYKNIPLVYQSLIEQVINGAQGLTWREYPLIHLIDENRVVPVESHGGYFREINWHTGEIDPNQHLIFKDELSGHYYQGVGLKGGGDLDPESLTSRLSQKELSERITVKDTLDILKEANDFSNHDFASNFQNSFIFTQVTESSVFDTARFFTSLYDHSPTFRRIFNHYYETTQLQPVNRWLILVRKGTTVRTDFVKKIIYIASDSEISKLPYVSNKDMFELTSIERAYLHEILHALTGKMDPLKLISLRNRGSIVYLTDKILSEAGKLVPPRVIYRRLHDVGAKGLTVNKWQPHLENAKALALQENIYLDEFIDRKTPLSEYEYVFGEALTSRYTFKESYELLKRFPKTTPGYDADDFEELLFPIFFKSKNKHFFNFLKTFFNEIFRSSRFFKNIFKMWYSKIRKEAITPWEFETNEEIARLELPDEMQVNCINTLRKKIYIFDDESLYLSSRGLIEVEKERQIIHQIVQVFTELQEVPTSKSFENRGSVVQITDKIIEEAKLNYPKRLAYALVKQNDFIRQINLVKNQFEAYRAAILEDRLLEENFLELISHKPSCCRKRTVQNETHSPLFFMDNKNQSFITSSSSESYNFSTPFYPFLK